MVQMLGKYILEKNDENLYHYFRRVGLGHDMTEIITKSDAKMEIKQEGEQWKIITTTITPAHNYDGQVTFKLGEEEVDETPGGPVKSITVLEDDRLRTTLVFPDGKTTKIYEFTDSHCILIIQQEKIGFEPLEARRYFKRV